MTVTSTEHATEQQSAPLVIVSCDTHVGPRLVEDLRPYCPEDLLGEFDAYAGALQAKREAAAAHREKVAFGDVRTGPDWGVRMANLQTPGHYDMHARLRDLDADGVAAEIMFHDSQNGEPIPFQSDTLLMRGSGVAQDFDLLRAGQHIYNQWLADVCSIEPERHIGLMHLPLWDIEAAIAELEWARSAGLKGLNFPYPKPYMEPYTNPVWDPFFSACEDLGRYAGQPRRRGRDRRHVSGRDVDREVRDLDDDAHLPDGPPDLRRGLRASSATPPGHHGVAGRVVALRAEGDGQHLAHRHA